MRIPERLQPLVEDGLVQEVIQPLMSGKEAALFVVFANGDYCVAKVYKDAQHRSFRHRAGYAEGRRVRNSRQRRAMEKGTRYGKRQLEEAWQNAEVDALHRLAEAGVRVPRPHQYVDGVLLMDIILDPEGDPAPRLFDVDLSPEEALDIHAFLVRQVVIMLCAGLVHGDLSECNVLLAWDGPVIIDLPQATDAAHNPNAMTLFLRDVDNLTRYLARFAPELGQTRYGQEIWNLYQRGELHPDSPLTGRFAGSTRKANTRAVLDEIEDAAREAMRIRAAAGDSRPLEGRRKQAEPHRVEAPRKVEPRKVEPRKKEVQVQPPRKEQPPRNEQGRGRSQSPPARSGPAQPSQSKPAPKPPAAKPAAAKPATAKPPEPKPSQSKPVERTPPKPAAARGRSAEAPENLDTDDLDAFLISKPTPDRRRG